MELWGKTYCSLDIETTGFDPLNNEILEVGFVFFKLQKNKFQIVEQWTQVFGPSQPVSSRILGLTGITQKELDKAPGFSSFRGFLQKKIGAAVLVGHNIAFDIRFLESHGIELSGQSVDTMDLVQFLLPTHHSYNLENLAHFFKVSHVNAHRALADSWAVIKLLEKLLGVFAGFPLELKNKMRELSKKADAPWANFLECEFPALQASMKSGKKTPAVLPQGRPLIDNGLYFYPWESNGLDAAVSLAYQTSEEVLLVVPKQYQMLELYKKGLASAVCAPEQRFNEQKFQAFLQNSQLSVDEVKFALKVLVWKTTNWQNDCLADLNMSFFGGQFRSFIAGNNEFSSGLGRVACCDQKTFLSLFKNPSVQGRTVVIVGRGDFERTVVSTIGRKASWGYVLYLLRSVYDPETEVGQENFKAQVIAGLSATDLYFGLANGLLLKLRKGWGSVVIEPNIEYAYEYQQVRHATENYCAKIEELNEILELPELKVFIKELQDFFTDQPTFVKWVDIAESRCSFHSMPLDISDSVQKVLQYANKICFIDAMSPQLTVNYFNNRFGMGKLQEVFLGSEQSSGVWTQLKRVLRLNHRPQYVISSINTQDLVSSLSGSFFPAAVVYENLVEVSAGYQTFFNKAISKVSVLAQNASGGLHKIFHNFVRHKKGLLLVSGKAVVKYMEREFNTKPIERVPVATLILDGLAGDTASDPYNCAVANNYPDGAEAYYTARFTIDTQFILWFFYSNRLRKAYIMEDKIPDRYRLVVRDLLQYAVTGEQGK